MINPELNKTIKQALSIAKNSILFKSLCQKSSNLSIEISTYCKSNNIEFIYNKHTKMPFDEINLNLLNNKDQTDYPFYNPYLEIKISKIAPVLVVTNVLIDTSYELNENIKHHLVEKQLSKFSNTINSIAKSHNYFIPDLQDLKKEISTDKFDLISRFKMYPPTVYNLFFDKIFKK